MTYMGLSSSEKLCVEMLQGLHHYPSSVIVTLA